MTLVVLLPLMMEEAEMMLMEYFLVNSEQDGHYDWSEKVVVVVMMADVVVELKFVRSWESCLILVGETQMLKA